MKKIVYICGMVRSGSTLISNILNEQKKIMSIGEFWYLWNRGFKENWQCNCGSDFHNCTFWNNVFNDIHLPIIDKIEFYNNKKYDVSINHTALKILPYLPINKLYIKYVKNYFKDYILLLNKIYNAIATNSEKKIIVDSSKHYLYGILLNFMPDFKIYYLHVIRDPRGAIYSASYKKKKQVVSKDRNIIMGNRPFLKSCENYIRLNLFSEKFFHNTNYYKLYLEKFLENPNEELKKVFNFIGIDDTVDEILTNREIDFKEVRHDLSGNPDRFKHSITIKKGNQINLNKTLRFLTSLLTLPYTIKTDYKKFL